VDLKILYTAMKYYYGKPAQGYSFEHENFYSTLVNMPYEIIYFDFMTIHQELGHEGMNQALIELAINEKPDLLFCFLFGNQIDYATIAAISQMGIITLNWFADDHWKFESYSQYWAPHFTWVVTTAQSALPKYSALGYTNVIKSQWACNTITYQKMELPLIYDVTFVGKPHGIRRQLIHFIMEAGFNVHTWGSGWETGRLSQEEMVRVFNQSRINLNFSSSSRYPKKVETLIRIFEKRNRMLGRQLRRVYGTFYKLDQSFQIQDPQAQIKARNFEIPGCGGFLLTGMAENLKQYYEIGKEIVTFDSVDDLIQKIRYYLSHEEDRAAIATAGYDRTIRCHTYEQRFHQIFRQIGLE
jgi:spore maturation protein CgeB